MFYSKTWNTQLIWDNREWFKKHYKNRALTEYYPLYQKRDYPMKYPKSRRSGWGIAEAKRYYNSEKHYARVVMQRHETPEPYRKHRSSFRWD